MDFSKVIVKHSNCKGFQRLFLNQPIKCLRRYSNNLQSPKQLPGGDRKAGLVCSRHYDRLRDVGYGKSYGNTIKVIVEAPFYMPCRPVFALGCCLSGAPYFARSVSDT